MNDFGNWSQPGLPHKGWTCVHVEDTNDVTAVCEMCKNQAIRYVHYMTHPEYEGELACGCICAGKMAEDREGAKRREKRLVNAARRRNQWPSLKRWRTSAKGNRFINKGNQNITVFRKGPKWSFRVVPKEGDASAVWARRVYDTEDAAKLGAFDALLFLRNRS